MLFVSIKLPEVTGKNRKVENVMKNISLLRRETANNGQQWIKHHQIQTCVYI